MCRQQHVEVFGDGLGGIDTVIDPTPHQLLSRTESTQGYLGIKKDQINLPSLLTTLLIY